MSVDDRLEILRRSLTSLTDMVVQTSALQMQTLKLVCDLYDSEPEVNNAVLDAVAVAESQHEKIEALIAELKYDLDHLK